MAASELERVDFPSLFVAPLWIEAHCVVPDGFEAGDPFVLEGWQLSFVVNHYRVRPAATAGQLAPAFHYRRSQIVMPQKAGKAPLTSSQICLEGVGPSLFGGWAKGGEAWVCSEHRCGCGWRYEYQPGEPMGMQWPTPLIQITATSEEQTDNIYDALRPMIDNGPLHELIPKTGEEFIRLPGNGRIDVVTSNARSRLGQRVTFVAQDETGIWTPQSGMVKVAETQRRGLAGMGGRAVETTNAWDPSENSVAQRTAASKAKDIYRLHPEPPAHLDYRKPKERRLIHQSVYAGSRWVDLDSIEAEAAELLEVDPAQAERFFGNRVHAGEDTAFDIDRWKMLADLQIVIADRSLIVIGVDGARFEDALAVVATDVEIGHQFVLGIWERPEGAGDDYEHPADEIDGVMLEAHERFEVWRSYIDPQWIEHLVDRWQGRWGEKRVISWYTNRRKQVAYAVRTYRAAITAGDLSNDGDGDMAAHVQHARRRKLPIYDEDGRQMWTLGKEHPMSALKIDAAMAGVLSWEARGDAIAAGAKATKKFRAIGV